MSGQQVRKRNRDDMDLPPEKRDVVVILEKAGLFLGRDGLVDAYDKAASTEIANPSLKDVRPDIVHQCLLALFDTDLAYRHRLRVYISTIKGKTIEVSPNLRPPRTYNRFKGLMCALLRDGHINSVEGAPLLKILPGSVAPVIPHGAPVIGLCNLADATVQTASQLAQAAWNSPVPNELQGGVKNVLGFYCISCTEDQDLSGVDYVTARHCLSVYPAATHILCARLCEGFGRLHGPVVKTFAHAPESAEEPAARKAMPVSDAAGKMPKPLIRSGDDQRREFHRGGFGGRGGDRGGFGGRGGDRGGFGGRGGDRGGFGGRGGDRGGFGGRGGDRGGFSGRGGDRGGFGGRGGDRGGFGGRGGDRGGFSGRGSDGFRGRGAGFRGSSSVRGRY